MYFLEHRLFSSVLPNKFIKAVKTYTRKNGQPQHSCRLVENYRVQDKVRQRTLLNLGSKWPVDKALWPAVTQRVQEKLDGQLGLWDGDLQIEQHPADIVRRLRARGWPQPDSRTDATAEVYLDSLEHEEPRSVGDERMSLKALEELGWFDLLQTLGITERDTKLCTALVIARMPHPSSEREALRWMLEDSAILEILELDQALTIWLSKLYRLSDLLWKPRSDLQQGLWQRERQLPLCFTI